MGYGAPVRRALRTAAALAAVALLAAGCGGGGGGSTAANDAKATYLSRGNAICTQTTLTVSQAARDRFGTSGATRSQILLYVRQAVLPAYDDLVRRLRALHPPSGDEQTTAAIYNALDEAVKKLRADPSLWLQPNQNGIFDRAGALARAYGFTQCGQR
jgi:hypothetical protein